MNPLERTILRQLFGDTEFAERVVPFLSDEYFSSEEGAVIYRFFHEFYSKFTTVPSFAAMRIALDGTPTLTDTAAKAAQSTLTDIEAEEVLDDSQKPWLFDQAEKWVQDRALYCALKASIAVMDDPKSTRHIIPDLLKDALAKSFNINIGHDYFADADKRYAFYHDSTVRTPFHLTTLNKLTNGGVPRKTLNLWLAGTNVGKSLALCDLAAHYVRSNLNVLYITCEMQKELIAFRIDANLFDVPLDDVPVLPERDYLKKIAFLRQTTTGRLIIQEYPTGTASVGDFRTLLQELRLKQHFMPDVIIVDYLTICASMRVKLSNTINSYVYTKFISEELRALGMETNTVVWSAAQFNRQGFTSTDPGLEHLAEGFAIAMTADFAVALVQTDELEKVGQVQLIELKNRYARKRTYQQHLLGMDTTRMKLYELSAAQLAASLPTAPTAPPAPVSVGAFSNRRMKRPLDSLRKESGSA